MLPSTTEDFVKVGAVIAVIGVIIFFLVNTFMPEFFDLIMDNIKNVFSTGFIKVGFSNLIGKFSLMF